MRSHGIMLPMHDRFFWWICACTPTAKNFVIAQITLEIHFIFTPKGPSALGPLTDDIASAFVYLQKSIGILLGVRGL